MMYCFNHKYLDYDHYMLKMLIQHIKLIKVEFIRV